MFFKSSQKSPLGAFTPVAASSNACRSGSSGSPSKLRRSKDQQDDRLGQMKSARKSLFGGKPRSITQEQAKRIVGRSTGRSVNSWEKHTKTKITRSVSITKKELLEPGGRKRKREDYVEAKRESQKRTKTEPKMNTRASTRLRSMTHPARESNALQGSASSDDTDNGRNAEKDNPAMAGSNDQAASEKTGSSGASKPRKPYKIRPLERVRTRAYSLFLASKLALKKARRENASVKNKTRADYQFSNEDQKKSGNIRKNLARTSAGGKQLTVPVRTGSELLLGDQTKSKTSLPSKAEVFAASSSTSADTLGKASSSKDARAQMRFSAKRTFPKKGKQL